jgi:hypothetical protein
MLQPNSRADANSAKLVFVGDKYPTTKHVPNFCVCYDLNYTTRGSQNAETIEEAYRIYNIHESAAIFVPVNLRNLGHGTVYDLAVLVAKGGYISN